MTEERHRFERLYRRHYHDVRRFVARRLAGDGIDDVVAEVFTVLWRRFGEAPGDERVLPWLYGVGHGVLANEYRSSRRRRRLTDHLAAQPVRGPSPDHAEQVSHRQSVAEAFDALGEADREVLRLVAWENLTSSEIALVLGCARTTAAMRVRRARHRLLHQLRQDDRDTTVVGLPTTDPEGAR